ncbi:MAG: 7-cyano-7-deazaguanine synthase [Pseudomonadota bacterium]
MSNLNARAAGAGAKGAGKALVLCSAGLDSTYNLLRARTDFKEVQALFVDYSHKAASQEYLRVKRLCMALKLHFIKIDLPWYRTLNSSLTSSARPVSQFGSFETISSPSITGAGAPAGTPGAAQKPSEWVPNRNAVFVNAAAAVAESGGFDTIVIGINKEEAERYPDNTAEFIHRANSLLELSTLTKPRVMSYSADMAKPAIFAHLQPLLKEFNLGKEYIWSCYSSYEKMCGYCESCLRLKHAIRENQKETEWQELFLKQGI